MANLVEIYKRVADLRAQGMGRDDIISKAEQGGWARRPEVFTAFGMMAAGWEPTPEDMDALDRDIKMAAITAERNRLKRENSKLKVLADKADRLVEHFRETAVPFEPVPYEPLHTEGHRQVMVALSSDEHIQTLLTFERMHGINEYDLNLARQRMLYFAQRQIDYIKRYWREKNITVLVDANLGDKFEGTIHDDAKFNNEVAIAVAIQHWLRVKNECYQMILKECPHLQIVSLHVSGNHTRRGQKQDVGRPLENDDAVSALALGVFYEREPRVHFVVPDSYFQPLALNGHMFLFEHSTFVRSWGGLPYYGLERRYKEYLATLERTAEHQALLIEALKKPILELGDKLTLDDIPFIQKHYCGAHFHTALKGIETAVGTIMLNGSLVGPNDFSLSMPRANQASQLLFAVHSEFGPTDITSIQLGHVRYPRTMTPAEVLEPINFTA